MAAPSCVRGKTVGRLSSPRRERGGCTSEAATPAPDIADHRVPASYALVPSLSNMFFMSRRSNCVRDADRSNIKPINSRWDLRTLHRTNRCGFSDRFSLSTVTSASRLEDESIVTRSRTHAPIVLLCRRGHETSVVGQRRLSASARRATTTIAAAAAQVRVRRRERDQPRMR